MQVTVRLVKCSVGLSLVDFTDLKKCFFSLSSVYFSQTIILLVIFNGFYVR